MYTRGMIFSVLIPTFNRAAILKRTLHALNEQTFPKNRFEVIVVDDGSTDETKGVLDTTVRGPLNLTVIHQANAGQGNARNAGLARARGELVLFLGDDTVPSPKLLQEHWKTHQKYPKRSDAVLGLIEWHPELIINPFMKWMANGSSIFGKYGGHQFAFEKLQRGEKPDFNFFYTSNVSVKRKLLDPKPFDPEFSKYGWEDIELGYRLEKNKKMRLHFNARAMVYHHHEILEDSLERRMEAIGRSAHIIDKKYPELNKLPRGKKKWALKCLTSRPVRGMIKMLNTISGGRLQHWVYYAASKKYFLCGVQKGYTDQALFTEK